MNMMMRKLILVLWWGNSMHWVLEVLEMVREKRADTYFAAAKAIAIDNPVTANILRKIAKEHLHTATEDNSMYQLGVDI